jgi:hypothetical protein
MQPLRRSCLGVAGRVIRQTTHCWGVAGHLIRPALGPPLPAAARAGSCDGLVAELVDRHHVDITQDLCARPGEGARQAGGGRQKPGAGCKERPGPPWGADWSAPCASSPLRRPLAMLVAHLLCGGECASSHDCHTSLQRALCIHQRSPRSNGSRLPPKNILRACEDTVRRGRRQSGGWVHTIHSLHRTAASFV